MQIQSLLNHFIKGLNFVMIKLRSEEIKIKILGGYKYLYKYLY